MSKKIKPAFPGRASSLGYEPGLTKLEWIVTQLIARESASYVTLDINAFVGIAQQIIKACEDAESKD